MSTSHVVCTDISTVSFVSFTSQSIIINTTNTKLTMSEPIRTGI